MAVSSIESLLDAGHWEKARARIQRELVREPDNHWLLTQLSVTLYEQGQYRESLVPLLDSLEIVPDCPLTLWNIAGALDALGKAEAAIPIYAWVLQSKKSADDDPCWESKEWTDSLKTDCVFRIGVCLEHLQRWEAAENCFRQYINLLLAGMTGTYSMDEATRHIRQLHGKGINKNGKDVRSAIDATLHDAGFGVRGGRSPKLSKSLLAELATAEASGG